MTTDQAPGKGRALTGIAWAVLLLGLWLWGRDLTDGPGGSAAPTTGDVAAVGRPLLQIELPEAHEPVPGARPARVDIPSLGITAPVSARGLDGTGAVDPPPYEQPRQVGWYGDGVRPGASGVALMVGHVDTQSKPAVFYGLSSARPGEQVRVTGTDGSVAEFTIDDVQVFSRDKFDAKKAYGQHEGSRAELRLITCGGTYDHEAKHYTANVVVSAYLTGAVAAKS
ncbi:class F sortase [Streptomyces spiroverticillatus]|uniref:Class F sortase n=1 Tax=Streptomyces finlayi TaxID=67296 RepID=A0A918WYZ2_9ACTN|nr:class F sortase [Streptomyces finlayi]GHA10554.1 class F sortase [Streptomyces spiroverticillatus]GHC95552.1 class F sortase [Streptomyces finlayi]